LSCVFDIGIWEHLWAKGAECPNEVGGRAAGPGLVEVIFIGVMECSGEVVRDGEGRGVVFDDGMRGGER
jgi:hypothetical protein